MLFIRVTFINSVGVEQTAVIEVPRERTIGELKSQCFLQVELL